MTDRAPFPHCDARILHAPAECTYCARYPDLHALREAWGIAHTGHTPVGDEMPCPADHARPAGSSSDHRRWPGNRPGGYSPPPGFADEWLDPQLIDLGGDPVGEGMIMRLGRRIRGEGRLR